MPVWKSNASGRGLRLQNAARRVSSTVVELSGPVRDDGVDDSQVEVHDRHEIHSESANCLSLRTYYTYDFAHFSFMGLARF